MIKERKGEVREEEEREGEGEELPPIWRGGFGEEEKFPLPSF